jgi:5-methylcytosine-specific restriction endonuclease McrA
MAHSRKFSARWRLRILRRDGWHCYLCDRPISPNFKWPHPLALSIDHVKPLSAGGMDDPMNLRPTHWHCNENKGDQLLGVELGRLEAV